MDLGNALCDVASQIAQAQAQRRDGHNWQLEYPERPFMLYVPEMLAFIFRPGVTRFIAWGCNWGSLGQNPRL